MTKDEFISSVAEKAGLSRPDAASAVDAFLSAVQDALSSGNDVAFTGFGRFSVTKRNRPSDLREAADKLREDASELERGHDAFRRQIKWPRETLAEIGSSKSAA